MDWTVVRDVIKKNGMRNSNCMAIAPTATTSNIVGAIPSIEPIYKNIYVKSNMSGDFTIVNPYLVEDLKRLGLWSKEMLGKLKFNDGNIMLIGGIPDYLKEKYKEVFQINPKWLIRAAAHRGKWIDQSQSLNIFFMSSSGKQLSEVYHYAWEMGLKTTYYLRTLAVSQVEKSTLSVAEHGSTHVRVHEPSVVMVAAEQTAHKETHVLQEHQNTIVSEMAVREPMPSVPRTKPISVAPGILGEAHTMGPKLCNIDDPSCESCQ